MLTQGRRSEGPYRLLPKEGGGSPEEAGGAGAWSGTSAPRSLAVLLAAASVACPCSPRMASPSVAVLPVALEGRRLPEERRRREGCFWTGGAEVEFISEPKRVTT